MRVTSAIRATVAAGLAAHISLTVFENSPDAKVAFGTRSKFLARLPQWRFFAPNPGVDNTHLIQRTMTGGHWGDWAEVPFTNPLQWFSIVWNPGSRAPKALFDTVQQLRLMADLGVSFEWAVQTSAYQLIEELVGELCVRSGARESFQFMILTTRPGDIQSTMQPILVSQEIPVATSARTT